MSYNLATKKATLNLDIPCTVTVKDESGGKDNTAKSLTEDKRWSFVAAQPPNTTEEE